MGNTCCKLPRRSRAAIYERLDSEEHAINDSANANRSVTYGSVNENLSTIEVSAKLPTEGTTRGKIYLFNN